MMTTIGGCDDDDNNVGCSVVDVIDIDVIWLKKDVRLHDHGPLHDVSSTAASTTVEGGGSTSVPGRNSPFILLYLFEPDQLGEKTVHGSHVLFTYEGLFDMEEKLQHYRQQSQQLNLNSGKNNASSVQNNSMDNVKQYQSHHQQQPQQKQPQQQQPRRQQCITVCHNTVIDTLEAIHESTATTPSLSSMSTPSSSSRKYRIARLLAHEETGHWQSYMRDRAVRKWCKERSIQFIEYNQTGVTRRLHNRDDFSTKFHQHITSKPEYPIPMNLPSLIQQRLIHIPDLPGTIIFDDYLATLRNPYTTNNRSNTTTTVTTTTSNSKMTKINHRRVLSMFTEIPDEFRNDRPQREQTGGETKALATLDSFVQERGSKYSSNISSPITSWNSCSRLSPYLAYGHVSLRHVINVIQQRQDTLKRRQLPNNRRSGSSNNNNNCNASTMWWIKSLQAFSSRLHWRSHFIQKLETEPQLQFYDLCPSYQHVRRQPSDWNQRHYEAWRDGTTGFPFVDACQRCLHQHGWINFRMRAMLVSFATYNLWLDWTKISSHLARVFLDYEPGIHYPQLQMQAGTTGINAMRVYNVTKQGKDQDSSGRFIRRYVPELINVPDQYIHEPWKMSESAQMKYRTIIGDFQNDQPEDRIENGYSWYPEPIVDEQESARVAKAKMAAVRKEQTTKVLAKQVYVKHGSRSRNSSEMNGRTKMVAEVAIESQTEGSKQLRINDMFSSQPRTSEATCSGINTSEKSHTRPHDVSNPAQKKRSMIAKEKGWSCSACTYWNDNPYRLVCSICSTKKKVKR